MSRGTPHAFLLYILSIGTYSNSPRLAWAAVHCMLLATAKLCMSCGYLRTDPSRTAHDMWLQAADAARRFNETWESDIQLLRHDCHHHTVALVESLTGESIDVWKLFPVHQRSVWL